MVRRFLSLLEREIRGLHEAAYLLAFFALVSQILALVRDRTFAHVFGAGVELDMYFAAFRVPDVVFAFLTIFVSSFALIPLMATREPEERRGLVGSVLVIFGVTAASVSLLMWAAMPLLMPLLVPGFTPAATETTVTLARIMLLQPILLGLSSIAAAWVQATRRFLLFAMAPIFYNIGIIAGVLLLYPVYGLPGLAWGVVLGALMHLLVQAIPTVGVRIMRPPEVRMRLLTIVRDVVIPSVPRSLALMGQQSLLVAFASIASLVSAGSISALMLAFNLQSFPITVVAVSYASALFPALAALYAAGDRNGYVRELWATVKHLAFWLLPATMFFIVLRAHIVRVILGSGAFSWDDTRITAAVVALFAVSLLAQGLILVYSRAYYAAGKTLLPIILNVGGSLVAGVLAYVTVVGIAKVAFLQYFVEALFRVSDVPGTLVLMIPAAYTTTMLTVALLFTIFFAREYGYDRSIGQSVGISFSASVIGAAATYWTLYAFGPLLPMNTFLGIFAQGAVAGVLGVAVWAGVLTLMKSQELADIVTLLSVKLARR